jgi:CRP-like cAMP-binding protein
MNKQDLLRKMLIDEDAMFERLVERASKLFKIDKTGNVIFLTPASQLTQRQAIALVTLGRYFAAELGVVESDTVTADALLPYVDTDKKGISARLADLKKEGVVQNVERGAFRISILGISKILDELEADSLRTR